MKSQMISLVNSSCSHLLRSSSRLPGRALSRPITTKSKTRGPASALVQSLELETEGHVFESHFPDVPLPQSPLTPIVFEEASKWGHKTATECGYTGRSYTYSQLVDGIMRWGGMLQRMATDRANPGTVAILAPNCPEYPIVFFGSIGVGATVTTINAAYTPEEIARHLDDSGANLLVVEGVMEPLAEAALKVLKREVPVVVNGPSANARPNLREIIADSNTPFADFVDVPLDRVAALPYSSGTTGKPKGVSLTHSAIANNIAMYHNPHTINAEKAEGDHQEVLMGLLPFFHIYGMCVIMSSGLCRGAKIVTLPKFEPQVYASVLKKHKISVLHTVPPLLQFVAASPAVAPDDLSHVHTVMCGAAPVPPAAAMALKEKVSRPIFFQEGFGMTETLCTHMTPKGEEKLGYCGKLVPHTRAKIVDLETGAALPPGAEGELCVHSPALMAGYHNNPEATSDCFDAEGWFHTGDVAVCDKEGYFSIVDRIKELIKVKGLQVSPSELEDILLRHPGVADVGITAVDDERAGEVPRAYVVRRNQDLSEKDLHTFLGSRVAPHKQLAGGIRFVEELPKNPTGKLLRRQLKKMADGE
ncbi:4-coumarate--CoA ligase 3-like isoform X2 [Penaeus chinensis]|uniref:4-coumarate--CoA ligase 3-like isoform X2 n=1 Tax=Penaeus chinensis TaxID=139456 RepID=UPI001FB7C922|nr:4-coumarate--CoA ligase 3-like isoform X2 [Penaeus chinensis]